MQTDVTTNATSLNNKVNSLKAQYILIRRDEQTRTGNPTEDPLQYPVYWDAMVTAFGDAKGLGEIEFGSEDPSDTLVESSLDDCETFAANDTKRMLVVQAEVDRQRKKRLTSNGKNNSINVGLEALGTTLAKGLVDAAANEIQEKSALVQDKLMEFLQARLG